MGCQALAKHGYIYWKDVTASGNIDCQFNTKLPKMTDQSRTGKLVANRVSYDKASDHVSNRQVHSPLIICPPLDYIEPTNPPEKNHLLLPSQAVPMPTLNGYANIYSIKIPEDHYVIIAMIE